ncbi:cation diffusion facilitator family transporter [Candidatus Paracaedibacter symbiosus]|uniref:cation diffusion facilitator family transporter n=1 Tax=Candidatus Paracaedibacter symbiosus TaxID=244582 RepID=UPI000509E638|nr:cation diffusion facilitator family transporter [Candidatus Paracaedibacter symbiosus]
MPHQHHHIHDINNRFLLGIFLNFLFTVVEFFYGIQANSVALAADAVHNAGDIIGLLIAWAGFQLCQKKTSAKFTYGLKNATIIAAFLNAIILLVAVGGLSWEAISRFGESQTVVPITVIAVSVCGILVNGISAFFLTKHRHHDINIQGAFLHMVLDASISFGVVVGGVLMLWQPSWTWIDPVITLLLSAVILIHSWGLFKESLNLMLMAVPTSIDFGKIMQDLKKFPGVTSYHDLHIWPISTTETALSVHLVVEPTFFTDRTSRSYVEKIRTYHKISHVTIQLETDDSKKLCEVDCT